MVPQICDGCVVRMPTSTKSVEHKNQRITGTPCSRNIKRHAWPGHQLLRFRAPWHCISAPTCVRARHRNTDGRVEIPRQTSRGQRGPMESRPSLSCIWQVRATARPETMPRKAHHVKLRQQKDKCSQCVAHRLKYSRAAPNSLFPMVRSPPNPAVQAKIARIAGFAPRVAAAEYSVDISDLAPEKTSGRVQHRPVRGSTAAAARSHGTCARQGFLPALSNASPASREETRGSLIIAV
jgi:hypothetical protein